MIIGVGLDLVELYRVETIYKKFGNRFCKKILTPNELAKMPLNPVAYLASRFAAKEAGVKALGTGFSLGITFQHLEITHNDMGKPGLLIYGPADLRAVAMGAQKIHLSISHGRDAAVAVVILESFK